MVSLVMLAVMAGCAAYLFLKGTLAQGITMIFNALIAGFIALGFYEMLAGQLIKYSPGIAVWAPLICYLLLFVLGFALLQAVAMQISKEKVDFGTLAEQIGRPVAGVVLGYIITGQLLVAAAMPPIPSSYPYARFDERNPNPARASKPLLSSDGFVTGLFGMISRGSFSPLGAPKSFAVLHADFLDELYLNRSKVTAGVPIMTGTVALDVPRKDGVWYAPDNLRDSEGKPVPAQAGETLMLVRVGIRKSALRDAGKFTFSQVRLICGPRNASQNALAGWGTAVYPMGYIGPGNRLQRKSLSEVITIQSSDVPGDLLTMDLVFSVPTNLAPALVGFKRNNLAQVSAVAAPEDAPQPIAFGAPAPQAVPAPETPAAPPSEPAPAPSRQAPGSRGRGRGLSDISRSIVGDELDEN